MKVGDVVRFVDDKENPPTKATVLWVGTRLASVAYVLDGERYDDLVLKKDLADYEVKIR